MKTEMPRALKRWEITRAKGKIRFILIWGILYWGGGMFVVATLFLDRRAGIPLTLHSVLTSACTLAICGAACGWVAWIVLEKKYKEFLAQRSQPEDA